MVVHETSVQDTNFDRHITNIPGVIKQHAQLRDTVDN
jgi:hypothetical protein